MTEVVIVDAIRTPMGRSKKGVFRNVRAEKLSALLIEEIVKRNNVNPTDIEDVIWGCVQQTLEQGFNVGRQAAVLAGLPYEVPAQTVNRLCGSSMTAIHTAYNSILAGNGDTFICGGVEHMGHVPMNHGIDENKEIAKGSARASGSMGITAENLAHRYKISRGQQDAFAAESHNRAEAAHKNGEFDGERVAINGHDAEGRAIKVDFDEVVRPGADAAGMGKLRPAFIPQIGSVTAGNSSALSDGASCVLVMSAEKAAAMGLKPMAKIRAIASSGCNPSIMGMGPVESTKKALARAGLELSDVDYFELNEAFAAQSLAVIKELGIEDRKDVINVRGGAIALGHPLGCSGARITGALAHVLKDRGGKIGVSTMCIGMGQGVATVIEAV